jgi:protein SPT2
MFKRPGGSGPARPRREVFSDDDDFSDDMEARLDDIEMEEKRGARIARKEDEDAEREERERRERKERMKRERERARGR